MGHRSPAFWVKIYISVLLFLFLLGAMESRVDTEGMGFLPLMVFTTPWSWLLTSTWDFPIWGRGLLARQLMVFVTCNALSGTANSYILYVLLKHRQRKILKASSVGNATEDEIRQFICPCPACGKGVVEHGDGHRYALLASEIAREKSQDLKNFFQLYKNRAWADLNQIQRFDGAFNAALIYTVQCAGGITVLALRSPVELWEVDSLLDAVVLDESEVSAINSLPVAFKDL